MTIGAAARYERHSLYRECGLKSQYIVFDCPNAIVTLCIESVD